MNRFGWLAAIIAVAMLFTGNEAKPNPVQPPPPSVDVSPETDPPPAVIPATDMNSELVARLDRILKRLDVNSLQTLADKLEAIDFSKLKSMIDLLNHYGRSIEITHEPAGTSLNDRLSQFEKKLDELAAQHSTAPESDPVPKSPATTTVCPCNGNDKNGCLCVQAGAKCHCTVGVGSVWQKTDQKSPVHSPAGSPINSDGGIPVRRVGNYLYWIVDGQEWSNLGNTPYEGVEYIGHGRKFTFRGDRIYDTTNAFNPFVSTVAAPGSRGGHYEKRCNGVQCWNEWVPN